jgi:hypothetical protein
MDNIKTDQGMKLIGIGEAQVVSVNNNGKVHRVKVFHPDVGVTDFIPFIQTPGMFRTPRIGDLCYVFMKENYHEFPMAWGHRLPENLVKQLIGDNRKENITVIYSSGANQDSVTHTIKLDDGEDNGIRITTDGGNQIDLKNRNEITVRHNTGSFIEVKEASITLSVKGSTVVMDASGIRLTSATGSTTEMGSKITHTAEGSKVDVGSDVVLESSGGTNVELSGTTTVKSADGVGKFDDVTISTHAHSGNLGIPTSPPFKG